MNRHAQIDALTEKLRAGLAGDVPCYHAFLSDLAPLLRRVVGRKIPLCDVEDVVQEILISVHKARHTYDPARPLLPWLMGITQFRVTDHLRKAYRGVQRHQVDIADYENVLEAVTETGSDNESVDRLLGDVAERERNILTLMHVEGYTAKQVGARMGMKESAVKVAAHRALKKLREKLSNG